MNFLQQAERTALKAGTEVVARILIDTAHNRILFVPKGLDHPEYLAQQLGKTMAELNRDPELVRPYVGAVLQLERNLVTKVLLGMSGLETLFSRTLSPVHTSEQLEKARDYLLATLQAAGLLAKGFELRMMKR